MKRLVVCTDGTWNRRSTDNPTNVEKLAQAILPVAADGTPQVVCYSQGVGTRWGLDRILGGAFGWGLSKNVEDAYRFLVDNYAPGDEIYAFGFSRGAFTARSMVGLIRKCDLLLKEHSHRFPEAYALYRKRGDSVDSLEAEAFRTSYSSPARITCLGVWDTVGSLGIPGHLGRTWIGRSINRNYEFHDVRISSKVVQAGYQALAIDEQRGAFAPAVWWREHLATQALEQAWFPGCHSDVGGGNVPREESARDGCLSDVALLWMVERAQRHGLEFDQRYLDTRVKADPLAPIHESRTSFYRLLSRLRRPIGVLPDDPALRTLVAAREAAHPGADPLTSPPRIESPQTIHDSARQRMAADPSYRPENLVAALARGSGE